LLTAGTTAWGGSGGAAVDVVVDPFGNQRPGFAEFGFGVMDAIKRCAALKRLQVI
jgi:hypothetical protein